MSITVHMDEDIIICRCEEVTLREIQEAIKNGARDVTGVKRRTRAGMGLCQGRTCERLIQQILKEMLSKNDENLACSTSRPPVKPITFGELGGLSK